MTEASALLQTPVDNLGETLGNIPDPLKTLFDRDPLGLTRIELNSIVAELRRQRSGFAEAEKEAKNAGRRVNAKKAIAGEKGEGLKLSANIADLLKDI